MYTRYFRTGLLTLSLSVGVSSALAGPADEAKSLWRRLVGVDPNAAEMATITPLAAVSKYREIAILAMGSKDFYRTGLKEFFSPLSSVAGNLGETLNDMTLTLIGMVRDNVPFDQSLYGDILFVGAQGLLNQGGTPIASYSETSNQHYMDLQNSLDANGENFDFRDTSKIIRVSQMSYTLRLQSAGVITSRAAGSAYFTAGTNRRMFDRFIAENFLCRDIASMSDVTAAAPRIGRDVTRSPSGNSAIFNQTCKGCHAGIDALRGAFATFNFGNSVQDNYNPTDPTIGVQNKMNQNSTEFPGGYITTDNSWVNTLLTGVNANLGWRDPGEAGISIQGGYGAYSLGRVIAKTRAFSQCQVKRVFKRVCLRNPNPLEEAQFASMGDTFEGRDYNLRELFADVIANMCPTI